ncbi:MAG: LytTR family DNA-binding domain-containing protein [Burkholderiales bacterium]|nr:LytTR family DNA-binding domain-containing protein [Burkholderiales bacterium]
MRPRAVIAEDEPLLAAALARELAAVWPELEVAATAANGAEALEAILAHRPDVVFLDIRMPGKTGLDVAAELGDAWPADASLPAIVFVTAYDEHALAAFELAAADYVLKPVRRDRLARTVERLKSRAAGGEGAARVAAALAALAFAGGRERLRFVQAGVGNAVRVIPVEEICYFQAADKYVAAVTREGEALLRTSLKELMPQLDPQLFRQVHRGTVVNLREVAAAVRDEAGHVVLKLRARDERLAVSRVFAALFKPM